jgi:hypothetical protein
VKKKIGPKSAKQIVEHLDNESSPKDLIANIETCVLAAMATNLPQQIILELDSGEFMVMLFTKV